MGGRARGRRKRPRRARSHSCGGCPQGRPFARPPSGLFCWASARYLAAAKYDEELVARTSLVRSGRSRLEFASELVSRESGRMLAEGRVVLACAGVDGRPKRPPPSLRERIGRAEGSRRVEPDDRNERRSE